MKKVLILSLLLCASFVTAQESDDLEEVYVTDQLRLQMLAEKGKGELVKTLRSGDRLRVLESSPQFYRVVTDDDIEGWVKKHYMEKQLPAFLRVQELETQVEEHPAELAQRDASIERMSAQVSELQRQLELKLVGSGLRDEYEKQLVTANQENVHLFNDKEQLRKHLTQAELKVLRLEDKLKTATASLDQTIDEVETVAVTMPAPIKDQPKAKAQFNWLPVTAVGASALILGLFFGRLTAGRRA